MAIIAFLAVPRSAYVVRSVIGIAGIVTAGLIFATASGIHKALRFTKMLVEAPAGSGLSVQSTPVNQTEAIIYVHAGDTITLDGSKIPLSKLHAALKAGMRTEPHLAIGIKCDKNASFDMMKAIIGVCESIRIKNIVFDVPNE